MLCLATKVQYLHKEMQELMTKLVRNAAFDRKRVIFGEKNARIDQQRTNATFGHKGAIFMYRYA